MVAFLTETRFGHFGLPAVLVAATAALALILHLAVPYAYVNYRDDNAESETLTRGEAADLHDNWGMTGASAPGVTLAGTIVLLVAGLGLLVLGFLPLNVTAARWSGWSLGFVAIIGGLLTFMSSMFWVGSGLGLCPEGMSQTLGNCGTSLVGITGTEQGGLTGGLTGLIEMAMQTDSAGTVIVIGPVLVAVASAVAILSALTVCGSVVSTRDGLRDRAGRHLGNARWALLLLALVLLLPWSIGKAQDYEGGGDRDWFVFGAHTIMNTDAATNGDLFGPMTYAMNAFIAAGWIGILLGAIGSLGGIIASQNGPPEIARATHYATFGTLFMALYFVVVYILAWSYMWKPQDNAQDFQPGYFPVLVLPVLAFWVMGQVRQLQSNRTRVAKAREVAQRKPVNFD